MRKTDLVTGLPSKRTAESTAEIVRKKFGIEIETRRTVEHGFKLVSVTERRPSEEIEGQWCDFAILTAREIVKETK